MSPHRWHQTSDTLAIRIDRRTEPVPDPLTPWLLGPAQLGLSQDAGADVIRVHARLASAVQQLLRALDGTQTEIDHARSHLDEAQPPVARPVRREAQRQLNSALVRHDIRMNELIDTQVLLDLLQAWVIELDASSGVLHDAAKGWKRPVSPPGTVEVFGDQDTFFAVDPRRAHQASWGGTTIDGIEQWGRHWRRDPDDEPSGVTPTTMAGTWAIGFIQRTGEVYAERRSACLPREIWLLGSGFTECADVSGALEPALPQMRAPNSLALAAAAIHAAELTRDCTPTPMQPASHTAERKYA